MSPVWRGKDDAPVYPCHTTGDNRQDDRLLAAQRRAFGYPILSTDALDADRAALSAPADMLGLYGRSDPVPRPVGRRLDGLLAHLPVPSLGHVRMRSRTEFHCCFSTLVHAVALRTLAPAPRDKLEPSAVVDAIAPASRPLKSIDLFRRNRCRFNPLVPTFAVVAAEADSASLPAARTRKREMMVKDR